MVFSDAFSAASPNRDNLLNNTSNYLTVNAICDFSLDFNYKKTMISHQDTKL